MVIKVKVAKAKEATISISMDETSAEIVRAALEKQCAEADFNSHEFDVLSTIIQGLAGDEL